ncbi:ferrous iron transport protein A [Streptomyces sp. NPDC002088]|uniref:ferrous iron transport protein A n=1 Tax=Streptomyces sp. NPDC002088 TaxID=3154665 RepID=UPI00331D12FA
MVRDPEWDGPWQNEFLGTIDEMSAPEPVEHPLAHAGELSYWVAFDRPQYDSAGGGPYRKAQIWDRYLRPESTPGT